MPLGSLDTPRKATKVFQAYQVQASLMTLHGSYLPWPPNNSLWMGITTEAPKGLEPRLAEAQSNCSSSTQPLTFCLHNGSSAGVNYKLNHEKALESHM